MANQELQKVTERQQKREFLTKYNPSVALTTLDEVKSLPDVFRVKTPSLARLQNDFDKEFVVDYLQLWIIKINDMVNAKNKMNDQQVQYTAQLILNENPLLTIADIKFVFDGIVSGRFGEMYNTIDCPKLCTWFRKHWEHRLSEAEAQSHIRHMERKEPRVERENTEIQKIKEAYKKWKTP